LIDWIECWNWLQWRWWARENRSWQKWNKKLCTRCLPPNSKVLYTCHSSGSVHFLPVHCGLGVLRRGPTQCRTYVLIQLSIPRTDS